MLWGVGRVLARQGRLEQASTLLAAIEADETALPPWIDQVQEPADHQDCLNLIEQGLTAGQLRRSRERGAAMTLHQATGYAFRILDGTAAE